MVYQNLFKPLGIDFPQYFDASLMFWTGQNMYERLITSPGPFNYPPTSFLFLWWPAIFPYTVSGIIWNLASVASLLLSIWLLLKIRLKSNPSYKILLLTCFIFLIPFFPVKHTIASGQINNFLLFFTVLSYHLYQVKHKTTSAALFAYAASIKITPILFLVIFIIKKDWKQLVLTFLFLCLFIGISTIILPGQFQTGYYTNVFFDAFPLAGKELYYNQSLLGLLTRSFSNPTLIRIIQYAVSGILVVLLLIKGRKMSLQNIFSSVACLLLIISPLSWQHHFVYALIPLILLKISPLTVLAYLLIAFNIKAPSEIPSILVLLQSHQLIGVLILYFIAINEKKNN